MTIIRGMWHCLPSYRKNARRKYVPQPVRPLSMGNSKNLSEISLGLRCSTQPDRVHTHCADEITFSPHLVALNLIVIAPSSTLYLDRRSYRIASEARLMDESCRYVMTLVTPSYDVSKKYPVVSSDRRVFSPPYLAGTSVMATFDRPSVWWNGIQRSCS